MSSPTSSDGLVHEHAPRSRLQFLSLGMLALKLLKSAKVVKAMLATASVGAYAWLFTWEFAIVLVVALCIHEAGHVWAMKRCGIPTKGFYLIPFVGGAAIPERAFASRWEEVYVAAMGPTWGIASIAVLAPVMAIWKDIPTAAGAAAMIALMNFFNLLPISPLDGGRIFKSVTLSANRKFGLALMALGTAMAGAGLFFLGSIVWVLIIVVSAIEVFYEYSGIRDYMAMNRSAMVVSIVWWLALGAVFLSVMHLSELIPGANFAARILRGH